MVRAEDEIILWNPRSGSRETFRLPAELRRFQHVRVYALKPGEAFVVSPGRTAMASRNELLWFNAAGEVTRREALPWEPTGIATRPDPQVWSSILIAPAPIVDLIVTPITYASVHGYDDQTDTLLEAYVLALPQTWPQLLSVLASAVPLAWLGYRRQRKLGLPWTGAWVAFILLSGLPGWIGYRLHRRAPPVTACPACGQPVPRDRSACLRCGVEFPSPALTGVEVLVAP